VVEEEPTRVRHQYKVEITRDGRWWMVHIPEIDGLTQARRIGEAEKMAREFIALETSTPITQVMVTIASITVPGLGDIQELANDIRDLRDAARKAEAAFADATKRYAKRATAAGIPVRDIAELLDVSPQRVSQLANA
jgi:hypothetical protein